MVPIFIFIFILHRQNPASKEKKQSPSHLGHGKLFLGLARACATIVSFPIDSWFGV
jgi:hypothetical protein